MLLMVMTHDGAMQAIVPKQPGDPIKSPTDLKIRSFPVNVYVDSLL